MPFFFSKITKSNRIYFGQTRQPQTHGPLVGIERFGFGHCFHNGAKLLQTFGCDVLNRDFLHETIQRNATIGPRKTVCRQCVVGA